MPIVQIHMLEGATVEQKRELAKRMTDVVCETLNRAPEKVRVIMTDMPHDSYAVAGVLHADATKS